MPVSSSDDTICCRKWASRSVCLNRNVQNGVENGKNVLILVGCDPPPGALLVHVDTVGGKYAASVIFMLQRTALHRLPTQSGNRAIGNFEVAIGQSGILSQKRDFRDQNATKSFHMPHSTCPFLELLVEFRDELGGGRKP